MQRQVRRPDDSGAARDEALADVLEALRARAAQAHEGLVRYASESIVGAAYADAQTDWAQEIRPPYLAALKELEQTALGLADRAPAAAVDEGDALRAAAQDLARARASVEALEIRPDRRVDEALDTDWWRTVAGKGQYAEAIRRGIERQMKDIAAISEAPLTAIRGVQEQQKALRTRLLDERTTLEAQFEAQGRQLATLSGAGGVLPIDLASFIGVFPLVLGVVLGLLLLRIGQARQDAARAAEELAAAAPEDRATRRWLIRRLLGGSRSGGPMVLTALIAGAGCVWIAFSAMQIGTSPVEPPVRVPLAAGIGIALVAAAAAWDLLAIRRLVRASQR
jgi:hypothetical protein